MKKNLKNISVCVVLAVIAACSQSDNANAPGAAIAGLGPNLAVGPDGTTVVSYMAPTESGKSLRYHVIRDGVWGDARTVSTGDNWFVNWADFPSVTPVSANLWGAHWLVRRAAGGYAYDVHAAVSEDAGETWSEPFLLHSDDTDTEHGFVTLYPAEDQIGAVWLDGRNTTPQSAADDGHAPSGGMTLRAGRFDASGIVGGEQVVDTLTCDCCQTDVAVTSEGPVAVYRDRTSEEIRDIYVSRYVDGAWQEGQALNNDNWNIAGCPVNGPVIKADGSAVVITWFTGADSTPTVKTAWSNDAGRSFSAPTIVAQSNVVGYVGSALLPDGSIVASWICKAADKRSTICYQNVAADGTLGELHQLTTQGVVARMSVPQLALIDDQLLFVWTDRVDKQFQINSKQVPLRSL